MSSIDLFGIFLLLATIAVIINRKLPKLPDTIGVMLFSLISCLLMLGVSQFWHHDILSVPKKLLISMDMPDIFLHVALPLLLFAGTMGVNLKHLLNRVVSITSLSIIGTVISIFVFGTILFYVFPVFNVHIGYSWCIAIGAILAPTDPVSVVSVLKNWDYQHQFKRCLQEKVCLMMVLPFLYFQWQWEQHYQHLLYL